MSNAATSFAPRTSGSPIRVAVLCDFAEENWPSMDLVGDMLAASLASGHMDKFVSSRIRPKLKNNYLGNLGRFLGRFVQYPQELARLKGQFDVFHVVDHSYSHLVQHLPAGRVVVTCHDLDTFRCLLEPREERRSLPFRQMTKKILKGLQSAAHVTCDTAATRDAILRYGLLPTDRLTIVHNGVAPEFTPSPNLRADGELEQILGRKRGERLELLHVGSAIPRKRIDILLKVFAEVRRSITNCRLLRVGGPFTNKQQALAAELGIASGIDVLPALNSSLVAAAYRRSTVTLLTSEAEGFGLPLIESLACGTPVVASDIPALREIGAPVVEFCPVGDVESFGKTILHMASSPLEKEPFLRHAQAFTWSHYAAQMTQIYLKVLAS